MDRSIGLLASAGLFMISAALLGGNLTGAFNDEPGDGEISGKAATEDLAALVRVLESGHTGDPSTHDRTRAQLEAFAAGRPGYGAPDSGVEIDGNFVASLPRPGAGPAGDCVAVTVTPAGVALATPHEIPAADCRIEVFKHSFAEASTPAAGS